MPVVFFDGLLFNNPSKNKFEKPLKFVPGLGFRILPLLTRDCDVWSERVVPIVEDFSIPVPNGGSQNPFSRHLNNTPYIQLKKMYKKSQSPKVQKYFFRTAVRCYLKKRKQTLFFIRKSSFLDFWTFCKTKVEKKSKSPKSPNHS